MSETVGPMSAAARRFAAGHGAGDSWRDAADRTLHAMGPLPEGASLGFVYATDALTGQLDDLLSYLKGRTGIAHWVGTVATGVAASGIELYDRPAVALLAAAMPEHRFRVFGPVGGDFSGFDETHRDWVDGNHPLLSIVHGDPRSQALPETVAQLAERYQLYLAGGLSSAQDGSFEQIADEVCRGGLSGVMLAGSTPIAVGLSQGCAPIGPVRTVSEAEHNVIMEIDGRPALEAFCEDIGDELAKDLRQVAGRIFVAFPVPGSDTGDYLVRNLTAIDPSQGWLGVGALPEEGQPVMFCRRDRASARQDLGRMLTGLKERSKAPPQAGLYFSCLARGRNLFGDDSEELRQVREALGDFPLAGFFANGEVSHDRLYGYTGVLVLFT